MSSRVTLVALWSFSQLLFSPRTLGMAILATTPVLIALVYRAAVALEIAAQSSGFGAFSVLSAAVSLPFVVPMLALFYASGVVTDDAEAGTLHYFLTRPVLRRDLLFGRMLGNLMIVACLFLPPFVLCYYLTIAGSGWQELGSRFPTLVRDILAASLGIFAYSGLFSLAGTVLKRPLLFGLFFVFGWQAGASIVPGAIRYLTVTHYMHSLMPHESFQGTLAGLIDPRSSTPAAILALLTIGAVTHALAIWAFTKKEI
jgi:ABC-type transport system involved in multi-copper enzyme maturation permease subunit